MSLTVVCGGPAAPLTGAAYDAIRAGMSAGRAVALALPTLPDVRRARMVFAGHRSVGLSVRELGGFIDAQWALLGDGRRPVSPMNRRALLSKAWEDCTGVGDPGEGLLSILSMLAQRSAEAEPLPLWGGKQGSEHDLVTAVAAYRALLEQAALIEPGEVARRVAAFDEAPGEQVVIHRFTELTPGQEAVVVSWARTADVLLTLPFDSAIPATRLLSGVVDRLTAAGAAIAALPGSPTGRLELDAVASAPLEPRRPVASGGAVSFVTAEGAEGEAWAIAARVGLAIAEGISADRIAVGFRDPDRHIDWLRRAFDARGIQADWDISTASGRTPLGRSLFALWAFASGGQQRADLGAFLRSPCAGMTPEQVDRVDDEWRAKSVHEGPALLVALGNTPQRRLIERAERLFRGGLSTGSVKKWKHVLDELIAYAHRDDPFCEPARLDAGVQRAFLDAAEALSRVPGSSCGQALGALRRTRIAPAASERSERVQVMDLGRLRTRRFDVVVLGGMNASEFPRLDVGDLFEGDIVRAAMQRLGIRQDEATDNGRERLLFALVSSRARSRLTLVRQATDDEGRELRESVFWDELLDIYRDPAGEHSECCPSIEHVSARDIEAPRTTVPHAGRTRGVLFDDRVLDRLAGSFETVSASDIEAYIACPYAWYLERVLRPRSPDVLLDARTKGRVIHDALARFHEALPAATGRRRVTAETLSAALSIADQAAEAAIADAPEARTLEERQALGFVRRAVRDLVERDAGFLPAFEPARIEWSFGREGDGPDMGGFRLKGRADRIDVGPEGLVIIDYKTGPVTPVARFEADGKVQLQLYALAARNELDLPVAGGLYRSLSRPVDRGFVSCDVVGPGLSANDRVDHERLDAVLEQAVEAARTAVRGMRAGHITPDPDKRRCSYCIAVGLCPDALR